MIDTIKIIPLTKEKFELYIKIGKKSYLQHYEDFWTNLDPSPYFNENFTQDILRKELKNKTANLFIIYSKQLPIGILKVVSDQKVSDFSKAESLLLQNIYILKEYSNKGVGSKALSFVEDFAREQNKKMVYLYAMEKSRAATFYLKNGYKIRSAQKLDYENIKDEKREMYVMVKKL